MTETKNEYTVGQVFLRQVVDEFEGKPIVMIVGILAVPPEFLNTFKGEHQYTVVGKIQKGLDNWGISISAHTGIDRSDISLGESADGLLRSPMWRLG